MPDWFPDATVWSDYGIGYGFVPAALPDRGAALAARPGPGAGRASTAWSRRSASSPFAEAVSWLGLLVGMFFKYVVDAGEGGVKVFGPIHGTVFLAYLVITLLTWRHLRWSLPVAVLALAASVPPFCTVLFEVWARRTGRLESPARRQAVHLVSLASAGARRHAGPLRGDRRVTFALDLVLLTRCTTGSAGRCRWR